MERLGKYQVTAKVRLEVRERLTEELKAQKKYRAELESDDRWSVAGLSRQDAKKVRAARRGEMERLRKAGELLDTVDVLAMHGIESELRARGWWDRRWPPVPGEAMDPGRWPGSRDGGYPKSVPLRLPQPLARTVYAACWHTSAKSIEALLAWRDRHPGMVPARFYGDLDDLQDPLREYARLASEVTTVGDVWRGGLDRGIDAAAALRTKFAN
ncbi:hypothetical protein ACH4C6_32700 [Streptomyces sp. NPDC017943]|uniref:hypothetical protein n=1 Tax=Streptomyces sp. NPDC017943 TaxID=3365019 RepID=UPI0037A69F47